MDRSSSVPPDSSRAPYWAVMPAGALYRDSLDLQTLRRMRLVADVLSDEVQARIRLPHWDYPAHHHQHQHHQRPRQPPPTRVWTLYDDGDNDDDHGRGRRPRTQRRHRSRSRFTSRGGPDARALAPTTTAAIVGGGGGAPPARRPSRHRKPRDDNFEEAVFSVHVRRVREATPAARRKPASRSASPRETQQQQEQCVEVVVGGGSSNSSTREGMYVCMYVAGSCVPSGEGECKWAAA